MVLLPKNPGGAAVQQQAGPGADPGLEECDDCPLSQSGDARCGADRLDAERRAGAGFAGELSAQGVGLILIARDGVDLAADGRGRFQPVLGKAHVLRGAGQRPERKGQA